MELTREELARLLGLPTGLALNQAVAVRVLGWRLNETVPACGWPPGTEETHLSVPVPDYSGALADAWRVVGEMARRGWWMSLKTPWEPGGTFDVAFSRHAPIGRIFRPFFLGTGPTPELAICRAALAFAASGGAE